jgi:hypothetical protein
VTVDGRAVASNTVSLQVVPAGQAPARRPSRGPFPSSPFPPGLNPFDPWKDLFGGDDAPSPFGEPLAPMTDPRRSLDAPRGAGAFLHAVVDKKRAVVGEQVTYTAHLYVDPESPSPRFQDEHDAPTPGFLKYPLVKDEELGKRVGLANVGGKIWVVLLFRKYALFPIKAGDQEIGSMSFTLQRRGGGVRESEPIVVRVTEPPVQGRPPGYALGDVGQLRLSAVVDPRKVTQGGAVGVTVTVSGSGSLPSSLGMPERPGVEWLPPETHEKLGPLSGDRYGGERTFRYVARLTRAGTVDLGTLVLPYWDPVTKQYATARAELGAVEVEATDAGAAPGEAAAAPGEVLPGLPAAFGEREGTPRVSTPLTESPLFWASLAGPSVAWGLFAAARRGRARLVRARADRDRSPHKELRDRLAAADVAVRGADPKLADAAIVRALEAAAQAHLALNVRGIAAPQVARALEERGLRPDDTRAVAELLEVCGQARFSPEAGDMEAVRERWARARQLLTVMEKAAP